jgi:hypothetical protein
MDFPSRGQIVEQLIILIKREMEFMELKVFMFFKSMTFMTYS